MAGNHMQQERINPLLKVGDHVITRRPGFTHHGLYLGDGQVLEYLKTKGVISVPLAEFTKGHELFIREHKNARYPGKEAVRRGMMRLGEQHYNLFTRNCEHFVNWCIEGVETSRQIDNLILTIIPFYALFQQSNFVRGCLRIIYDDPDSLDKALARVNWHDARNQNPVTRAQELSEDMFGTTKEGVVHFATLFTTAAQLSQEYSAWLNDQIAQEQRLTQPQPPKQGSKLAPLSAFRHLKTQPTEQAEPAAPTNPAVQAEPTELEKSAAPTEQADSKPKWSARLTSLTSLKRTWQHLKDKLHLLRSQLYQSVHGLPVKLEVLKPDNPAPEGHKYLPMVLDENIPNIHIKLDPREVKTTVATATHSVSYHAPYQRPMTRAKANELAYHVADQIEQELRAQYELRSHLEDEPQQAAQTTTKSRK
ncbi:MAG TPA: lecithin retinol acyltransferase family protein [Candidatus Anaerobiospirillum stercoravium]|nr:lecithin retinol acyltransferase family protein [Candidatus Anaerobiospirillum stercoravium]